MYSLQRCRFLNDQQGFLCVTPREQVCQHITDYVFYMIVVISESPERLCFSIVRSNDYAYLLSNHSCDRHLWTYRPFTSFYHVTSTEPRQNRKPCGQLSSLASETHHRTAFSKLMNLFWDLLNFIQKIYRSRIERNLTGVLGLNMFYGLNSINSESLVILRSNHDKATNDRKLPIHKNELAVRSVFSTITHEEWYELAQASDRRVRSARSAPWGSSLVPEALYATQFSHDRDKPSISQYETRRADWSQPSRCRCRWPGNAIPEYSNAVYDWSRRHTISSNSRTKQFDTEWQFFLGQW